jgi:hypothetical protein
MGESSLPAKDRYHDKVIRALVKDGWTITGEQVKVIVEDRYLFIDIEASRSADNRMALIEVKELDAVSSPIDALAAAVGKYFLYRVALKDAEVTTPLYLAVSEAAYQGILQEKIGQLSILQGNIALVVFDPDREEILRWIH